jgi:hypothetical protein
MDFNDFPDMSAARERRLHIRATIRANNHIQPRCSGCGTDMLFFKPEDILTPEQFQTQGSEFLTSLDYRPGDLICFECWFKIGADDHGRTGFMWGHA